MPAYSDFRGPRIEDGFPRIGALQPRPQHKKFAFVGFRNVLSNQKSLVLDAIRSIKRRRAVGAEMPRPVLYEHISGVRLGGRIQRRGQGDFRQEISLAHAVDRVDNSMLNAAVHGFIDDVERRPCLHLACFDRVVSDIGRRRAGGHARYKEKKEKYSQQHYLGRQTHGQLATYQPESAATTSTLMNH